MQKMQKSTMTRIAEEITLSDTGDTERTLKAAKLLERSFARSIKSCLNLSLSGDIWAVSPLPVLEQGGFLVASKDGCGHVALVPRMFVLHRVSPPFLTCLFTRDPGSPDQKMNPQFLD